MIKRIRKIFAILGIFGLVFVNSFPLTVNAAELTTESLLELLNNTTSTSDITESPVNSGDNQTMGLSNKQQAPTVDVVFSSSGAMQAGSMITATATPGFFNDASDPQKLYFTWYLKHSNCDLASSLDDGNRNCDLDGNGKITENDWKISAAKIIIKGSFDPVEAKYDAASNTGFDENSSGYKAKPSPLNEWEINSGASDNDKDASNCYVQASKSGLIYELRKTDAIFDDDDHQSCPDGYAKSCVSDQLASCDVLNPEYTPANISARQNEIDAAIAWNLANPGDLHVVPSQISKTIANDFGACAVSSNDPTCSVENDSDLKNFRATVSCSDGDVPMCVKDGGYTTFPFDATDPMDGTNPLLGIIFGKNIIGEAAEKETICSSIAKPNENTSPLDAPPNFLDNTQPAISSANEKCSVVKDEIINGNDTIEGDSTLDPVCAFKKDANLCKHLFAEIPGAVTGDGKFTLAEKQFWGADPTKPSTNGKGVDEENVVGLGVDKFSWLFSTGDQIGVVVEGDSAMPTEHADPSYKRMWAFSKGVCSELDDMEKGSSIDKDDPDKNTRGFYVEGDGTLTTGFLTAEVDLDDCLEENLLDPETDGAAKLTVQLNTSPANPINDPNGRGDVLNVAAGATNTQNPAGLLYKWSVQKSRDGSNAPIDTTSWQDITTGMENGGSFLAADLLGLGKKDLAINLNLQNDLIENGMVSSYAGGVFYLRIKVKISGTAADGSQNAEGSVVVRINQQQDEIKAYPVTANNAGMLAFDDSASGTTLCDDATGKTVCYVTKNEIIGVAIPKNSKSGTVPFSWTINGNPITCSSTVSAQCANGNVLFFPILGNVGEAVDVVAKSINKDNESVEVSRHFVIISPQIQIMAMDASTTWPKLLGYYKDLDGNRYPDYSTQVLETNSGVTATLGAIFYPSSKAGQAGFDWAIDGQIMGEYHNQSQIQIPVDKLSGESYNIGLVALYSPGSTDQVNNIRKALLKNWGISPEDVIEQNDSANIQLNVVDGAPSTVADGNKGSASASLITHLPEQMLFLFKISLTSILLLLTTGVLFAIMSQTKIIEKE